MFFLLCLILWIQNYFKSFGLAPPFSKDRILKIHLRLWMFSDSGLPENTKNVSEIKIKS